MDDSRFMEAARAYKIKKIVVCPHCGYEIRSNMLALTDIEWLECPNCSEWIEDPEHHVKEGWDDVRVQEKLRMGERGSKRWMGIRSSKRRV